MLTFVRAGVTPSSGARFHDRGQQSLKGVGDPVCVRAVREAGAMAPQIQYIRSAGRTERTLPSVEYAIFIHDRRSRVALERHSSEVECFSQRSALSR